MDIELGQSNPTPGWSWFTTKMLMMIHVMQNITVKPVCPYIGVVVFSIIIHNIKTIPEVSMHLCKFWAKVTPFYGSYAMSKIQRHAVYQGQ